MDITILIAPKGCTRTPVAFKPSVHVYTVPDGVDVEIFVEKAVSRLSDSYHNGVYSGSFKDRECHMEEFREYVMRRECERLAEERTQNINQAYGEVVGILMGTGDYFDRKARLNHLLRRIIPGISNVFCRWILYQSATPKGYVDLDGFYEIIARAEAVQKGGAV